MSTDKLFNLQLTIQKLEEAGFAYVKNGSVYFDVEKFAAKNNYGKLSGRKIEDLYSNTRELDAQSEKRSSLDFALWKNASPEHLMKWPSPWGQGFPGWHIECTAMSTKYLGLSFDIHGGGLDLLFPHHEAEMAQGKACFGHDPVKYWMHNNLITINGQKMGKSLGNFITLDELFSGSHPILEQAYSPVSIRFFILQAHYRSPLDFSNSALQAAEKGMERLFKAIAILDGLTASATSTVDIAGLKEKCYTAINDDLNTPILIAHLFDGVKMINSIQDGKATISASDLTELKKLYSTFTFDILGLQAESGSKANEGESTLKEVVDLLLNLRIEAKNNKDWGTSDKIRNSLTQMGFEIKDTKDGFEWELKR